MKILLFFQDRCKTNPRLLILFQHHLSIVSNKAGVQRVFNQSGIIADPMRSNISPNTYQNVVKHRVNMNIFCIMDNHVVCEFLRHKKDGWIKKKDVDFHIIIENEESRTFI